MSTNPPPAPPGTSADHDDDAASGPAGRGPRVTADEARDLSRLRLATRDKKVAGVAGGLARHFDVDPLVVRVLLVVLAFFGGAGVLIYGVCWAVLPADDGSGAHVRLDDRSRSAALLVAAAVAALALVGDSLGGWDFPWPLAVVALVGLVVVLARQGSDRTPPPGTPVPPAPGAEPEPGSPGWHTGWHGTSHTGTHAGSHTGPWHTATWQVAGQEPGAPAPYTYPPRRRGPVLFWYAVAAAVLGLGLLATVDGAGVDVDASAYPALVLVTCGATLVLAAFWGRGGGLIALGLVAALSTAATALAPDVETGHVEARPTTAAGVQPAYELTAGEVEVDLTDVADLEALDGRTLRAEVVFGRVAVTLPDGLDADIEVDLVLGEREVLGDRGDDDVELSTSGSAGSSGADLPTITIEASAVFGEVVVQREGDR